MGPLCSERKEVESYRNCFRRTVLLFSIILLVAQFSATRVSAQLGGVAQNGTIEFTFTCSSLSVTVQNTSASYIVFKVDAFQPHGTTTYTYISDSIKIVNGAMSGTISYPQLPSDSLGDVYVFSPNPAGEGGAIFEQLALCNGSIIIPPDDTTTPPPGTPIALCSGAPTSYMSGATKARTTHGGGSLRVRSNPGVSASVIGHINSDEEFLIVDGPQCADGYTWWKINDNSLIGWVAERDAATWFIKPIDPTLHGTKQPTTYRYARIIPDVDIWPMYAKPNDTSQLLGNLAADEYYELLDGQDGWVKVRTPDGTVGWIDGAPVELGNFFAGQLPSAQDIINTDGSMVTIYQTVPQGFEDAAQFLHQQALAKFVQLVDTNYFFWHIAQTGETNIFEILCQSFGVSGTVQNNPAKVDLFCTAISAAGAVISFPDNPVGAAITAAQVTLYLNKHIDGWLEPLHKWIAGCPLTTFFFGQTPPGGCLP